MHSPHPDVHEVGLVDGCPACAEAAENPAATLDERMLYDLLARTLDNRFRDPPSAPARSEMEAVAMATVLNVLERIGRFAEVAPDQVQWYLAERWRVDLAEGTSEYTRALREELDGSH